MQKDITDIMKQEAEEKEVRTQIAKPFVLISNV